jgi:hypothetical protein
MIDPTLLERLLRGGHVDMEERISLGAWPHPPLKLDELIDVVASLIDRDAVFPRPWEPAVPGQPVHEGGVVIREKPKRYVYRTQRHHPMNPTLLAETAETVFRSAHAAAKHYLKWDLGLPGTLDGWKVVR